MKKAMLSLATVILSASPLAFAEKNYELDTAHSKVTFSVVHLGISTVEGRFRNFEAKVNFDPKAIEKSTLEAKVKVESVDTDDAKRDGHLKGDDFFDVAKFPDMTFKSEKISKVSGQKYKMEGQLTIHGVTKKVAFDLEHKGDANAWGKDRSAFDATTKVSRSAFGLKFAGLAGKVPVVSDEVEIKINAVLVKDSEEAPKK